MSRSFHCMSHTEMYTYIANIGFDKKPGQYAWKRGNDRAYIVNPELGLLFVEVFLRDDEVNK